jgi:chaperonin cofactor prefoldin
MAVQRVIAVLKGWLRRFLGMSEAVNPNISVPTLDPNIWIKSIPDDALQQIFAHVATTADKCIAWYARKKKWKVRLSQWLRLGAILLVILGGMAPIIGGLFSVGVLGGAQTNNVLAGYIINQAGYMALAVAAGLALLDRYFGFSTGWIRYITTLIQLEHAKAAFLFEWIAALAPISGSQLDSAQILTFLKKAQDFQAKLLSMVEKETQEWVAEFQTNLKELERLLAEQRQKAESAVQEAEKATKAAEAASATAAATPKSGAIQVKVEGAEVDGEIALKVDGKEVERFLGVQGGHSEIEPGIRQISITGKLKSGAGFAPSVPVQVTAGQISAIAFTV